MSHLTFENIGRPLGKITGGRYNDCVVSVTEEATKSRFTKLNIADGKLHQLPNPNTEREIIYITGASGSGKSTYCVSYIKEYQKKHKRNRVILLSALTEDETIDQIKTLKRIKLDERMYTDPLKIELFEDSLVIFDDIDVISDKKIREAVYLLLNQVLEIGRHFKISCLITNHLSTNGKDTRRVLNEANEVVYFPHSGSAHGIKYLLEKYVGVDKEDMKKAKKSKSRWACCFKNYPQIMMTEHDIWMLNDDDDSDSEEEQVQQEGSGYDKSKFDKIASMYNQLNTRTVCPCGGAYDYKHKASHMRTDKHKKYYKK